MTEDETGTTYTRINDVRVVTRIYHNYLWRNLDGQRL